MALADFRRRVDALLPGRDAEVIVFGSRARGEGRADSDLDVCVAFDAPTREERRAIIDASADVSMDHGVVLSPLVVSRERLTTGRGVLADVRREGIAL